MEWKYHEIIRQTIVREYLDFIKYSDLTWVSTLAQREFAERKSNKKVAALFAKL